MVEGINIAPLPVEVMSLLLAQEFAMVPRPETLFSVSDYFRSRYMMEFDRSDTVDLATAFPSDVAEIYEANTFYSPEGYLYRFPRAFDFAVKWGDKALSTDFVSVIFHVPRLDFGARWLSLFNDRQKACVWLALQSMDSALQTNYLDPDYLDQDDFEQIAINLFASREPPWAFIAEVVASVTPHWTVSSVPAR